MNDMGDARNFIQDARDYLLGENDRPQDVGAALDALEEARTAILNVGEEE